MTKLLTEEDARKFFFQFMPLEGVLSAHSKCTLSLSLLVEGVGHCPQFVPGSPRGIVGQLRTGKIR